MERPWIPRPAQLSVSAFPSPRLTERRAPQYTTQLTTPITSNEKRKEKEDLENHDNDLNLKLGIESRFLKGEEEKESRLLTGRKLSLVFLGMLLAIFLIALDQTILAPALPVIASKFNALDKIAWIASAYFLTQTSLLLLYGQALTVFDRKWTFLFSIAVFELGSLICAVARTVDVLIFGRAVAGCGAAGIFVSCISIVAEVTTLEQRPKLLGLFGGVFAISSLVGPLMGGAFTDHVSWRWCFYINLPFGIVTVSAVTFILGPMSPPPLDEIVVAYTERKFARWTRGKWVPSRESIICRIMVLDWWGSALMLGCITCLLLPLQWGDSKYHWSDPVMVGTLSVFGFPVITFFIFEWKFAGETSILPLRLFRNRTQVGSCLETFFVGFVVLLATYYLPIFFQATKGVSATKSGVDILPFMLGVIFSSGISGGLVSAIGYYWPSLFGGPIIMCIGSGLLSTLHETSSYDKVIGYQIILSIGAGTVLQNNIIAVQADIGDERDVPQATALVTFAQLIGSTGGISIASSVFGAKLSSGLREFAPDAPFSIVRNSVEAIRNLPSEQKSGVIHAYVLALSAVFLVAVGASGLATLSSLLIRNICIKGKNMMAGA